MSAGRSIRDVWPLSPFQAGMLYLDEQSTGRRRPYLCQAVVTLDPGVDPGRLAAAYAATVGAHDLLSARFRQLSSGEPVAIIPAEPVVAWRRATSKDETFAELCAAELDRGFDLASGPCLRAVLAGSRLVLTTHHIIFDGWSVTLFVRDLMRAYRGEHLAAPQFSGYLARLRELDPAVAAEYWRKALDGVRLPTWITSRGLAASGRRVADRRTLDQKTALAAATWSAANGVTVNALLVAAIGSALGERLGRADVVLGLTVADRSGGPGDEDVVGPMINTVPLRVTLGGADLVREVHRRQLGAVEHSAISVAEIESAHGVERLFDTLVVSAEHPSLGPAERDVVSVATADTTHYPVGFEIDPRAGTVTCVYDPEVFTAASATLMLDTIERTVRGLTSPGGVPAPSFWNLFADVSRRRPDAPALTDGADRLSYAELGRRAGRLANRLYAVGVRRGDRVVVSLPRSAGLFTSILAVSRCGATVVPVDVELSSARREAVLARVRPKAVLSGKEGGGEEGPELEGTVRVSGSDAAYIIFTSGSTGEPKGVVIPNRALASLITVQRAAMPSGPGSRVLQFSSPGFDVLFWEFAWSLLAGAELVVVSPDSRLDAGLPRFLCDQGITHAAVPPAVVVSWPEEAELPADLTLGVGTENMPPVLVRRLAARCRLLNAYGTTETTVNATLWRADPGWHGEAVPLGEADIGKRIYVLDAWLRPVPAGGSGEIFIAGAGVATGYLDDPALTAWRFPPDPFGTPGERMYRTGDAGRLSAGGELEFLGRLDRQVQIRGFRVEVDEVEQRVAALDGVSTAAVVARESPAGGTELVAYVVAEDRSRPEAWRDELAKHLPAYMLPSRFVAVDALPLTPNNKIDRDRLPEPPAPRPAHGELPGTDRERRLADAFAEILGLPVIGVHDDFFAHGGHSLSALRLLGRIREEAGQKVPLQTLLDDPTVRGVARSLAALAGTDDAPKPARAPGVPTPDELGLYLLNRADPGSTAYTIAFAIRLDGAAETARVVRAVTAVVARHPVLRSRFHEQDGSVNVSTGDDPGDLVRVSADHPLRLEPFDLRKQPPARFTVIRLSPSSIEVVCVVHHIVFDADSVRIFCADLARAYRGEDLPALPRWSPPGRDRAETDLGYWRRALAEVEPAALPGPAGPARAGIAHVTRHIGAPLVARLELLGRRRRTSTFVVLAAAVAAAVSRASGRRRFLLGSAVSTREDDTDRLSVGYRIRMGLLRCAVGDGTSPAGLIDMMDAARTAMLTRPDATLADIVRVLPRHWQAGRAPFDVFLNYVEERAYPLDFGPEVTAALREGDEREAKFPVAIDFVRSPGTGALTVRAAYDTLIVGSQAVTGLLDDLEAAVAAWPADEESGAPGGYAPQKGASQKGAPREGADVAPDDDVSFWKLFLRAAAVAPDAPAVSEGAGSVSFAELGHRAGVLANLLRERGVRRGDRVVVSLPRSTELVTAILAISRCGAAVASLPADLPPGRLQTILADLSPAAVVCRDGDRARFGDLPTVEPTAPGTELEGSVPTSGDDAAYIVFTSGSTGTAKGVILPNKGLTALIATQRGSLPSGPGSRVLQFSAVGFDMIYFELCWSVLAGGDLVIVDPERRLGAGLARFLTEERITHAAVSPSVVLTWPPEATLPAGTTLAIGSEKVPPDLLRRWSQRCRVVVGYGPTETTVNATMFFPEPGWLGTTAPIGTPDAGKRIYLLDPELRPVPQGVIGEIYIAGAGLADGYLSDPVLTAQRFLPDVFGAPGERMYRTGDLACHDDRGILEFHGRVDDQVKIRGLRIEPAEIEQRLMAIDGVTAAVVVPRTHPVTGVELVAYLVADEAGRAENWRRRLAEDLPAYMIPARFVLLDALPLNENNKVDRRALPDVPDAEPTREDVPRTELERQIAESFAAVLGLATVGVHDDFFAYGGHSLLALKLADRVRRVTSRTVPLRALFEARTVSSLCSLLEAGGAAPEPGRDLLRDRELALPARRRREPDGAGYLLTGATGFFGVHLLAALLERSNAVVHCLVRSATEQDGVRRVERELRAYGLFAAGLPDRLRVHSGDLAQPRFGLPPGALAGITSVIHSGARVNHLEQYATLRQTNALSALEILHLADEHGASTHFVSTLAVADHVLGGHSPAGGYDQSKWVADGLFRRAAGEGHPVTIHRPGHLGGRPGNGRMPAGDAFVQLVRTCVTVGGVPAYAAPLRLLPVDRAAAALLDAVLDAAGEPVVRDLAETHELTVAGLAGLLGELGHRIRLMDRTDWHTAVWRAAAADSGGVVGPVALAVDAEPQPPAGPVVADDDYFRACVRRALADS